MSDDDVKKKMAMIRVREATVPLKPGGPWRWANHEIGLWMIPGEPVVYVMVKHELDKPMVLAYAAPTMLQVIGNLLTTMALPPVQIVDAPPPHGGNGPRSA